MTFDWAVWQNPLLVLVAGVAVGVALLLRQSSDRSAAEAEGRRRDLEREHAAAVEALRALEIERDKMEPADYERERKALLARGAAALRALDGDPAMPQDPTTPAPGAPDLQALVQTLQAERARVGDEAFDAALRVATGRAAPPADEGFSPAWRGALYASALWGLVAVLVVFAGDQSTPRAEGGSMTGGTTMGQGAPPSGPPPGARSAPDFDAMAAPLEARLAENPQDLEALNELTQLALSAGDASRAMQYNQRAAAIDPDDPDVGAFKGALAATVGMIPRAIELLDEVLARHPDHARSLTYKGLLLLENGQHAEAVPVLEKAVALQPGVAPLQQALEAARRGEGLPALGGAPPAPVHPPTGAAAGEVVLSGTLELAEGASSEGAVTIFVSVRSPEGGPPLAAKQLPVGPFPLDFTITTADAISMGGPPRPFPPQMSLSVRLDGDGNAMTREGLPSAGAGGVKKGTTGIALTLE